MPKVDKNVYYRISYHNEGIYNALKNKVDNVIWKDLLNNEHMNWLPKPPTYSFKNISYFTRKGYERFNHETLPIICNYLNKENIRMDMYNEINYTILYSDEYQIVVEVSDQ